jgi:hypothetical protein
MLTALNLHVPNDIDREIQSKMSIRHSDAKPVKPKKGSIGDKESRVYKRWTRLYQCLCGTKGDAAIRPRGIPWGNIGCFVWVRLVTTHDETDPKGDGVIKIWLIFW